MCASLFLIYFKAHNASVFILPPTRASLFSPFRIFCELSISDIWAFLEFIESPFFSLVWIGPGIDKKANQERSMKMTSRSIHIASAILLPLILSACTTTGVGGGQVVAKGSPDLPVTFTWKSKDGGISGEMTASLPGTTYQGRFFQITQNTRAEVLGPLWSHWRHGWYDWPYWAYPGFEPYPATQFITHYSGKVVATLEAGGDQRMRCRFHLANPAQGMSGGGEGECQLSDGRTIRANFSG